MGAMHSPSVTRWGWLVVVALVGACDGAPPPPGEEDGGVPTRELGETCLTGNDCISSLCIAIEPGRAICTQACANGSDCPRGSTWGCVQAEETATRVCACVPDAGAEVCGDGLDNECNGRVDDCRLCDGVPVPEDSRNHCGACGNACRIDQECSGGECGCLVGLLDCGGRCIDPTTDELHCGGCGVACAAGGSCVAGACECPAGTPDACSGVCVDTRTDEDHCGSCGDACPATLGCVAGACRCTSPAAPLLCEGSGCVDPSSDPQNCGGCGIECPAAQRCASGSCRCPLGGQWLCGDACVDLLSDPSNCGTCGNRCATGAWCRSGTCTCESGLVCGGTCVPFGDPANCGACGRTCRADQYCSGLSCQCRSGTECGGVCMDTLNDPLNCGACGNVCGTGMLCSSGRCTCASTTPYQCAELGGCFDLRVDPMHCGSCTNACPAAQICSSSACRCPIAGQSLCAATGTCVDLQNDEANCGTCGNVCPAATTCRFGTCACPAGGSARYCGSVDACVDVASDPLHCGGCDVACPGGTTCSSGACRCDVAGQTLCGSTCTNLQTDVTHCGSCTNVCAPGRSCTAGACVCPAPVGSAPVRLSTSIASSIGPAIAAASDRAAIAWLESGSSGSSIVLALVRPDGTRLVGTDLTVVPSTTRGLSAPAIVWTGTEFGIAWGQQDPATSVYRPMFQRISVDGAPLAAPVGVGAAWPASTSTSEVALGHHPTNGYALAAASGDTVYFQMLGADGSGTLPLPVPVTMSAGFSGPRGIELVAAPDGRWGLMRSSASAGTRIQIVNADGSVTTSPIMVTTDGAYSHDLTHDGATWVMPLGLWASTPGYRPVLARGATLSTTLAVRAATSTRVVEPSLTLWGREALALSAVYPDATPSSAGTLEVTRVTLPAGATGTMSIVTPSAPLGSVTTVSRAQLLAAAHLDANHVLVAWSDTRWGQLEIYAMGVTVASCQ